MKEIRKKGTIIIYKGDFKRLEEFGFELSQEENQYTKKVNTVSDGYQTFYETIYITSSRIIKSRLYNDLSNFEWTGYVDKAEHYIKDLDNAGLLEFKDNMCEHRCLLKSENEELKKFITEGITVVPHSPYKNYRLDFLRENFVSKKKIKDKIEELSKTKGDLATHIAVSERIRALQEILESEDSKDGEN